VCKEYFGIGQTVESLQSHFIHTMSHWSSGLPVCFLSWGTLVQSPGRYLCETRILLLALSRYIVNPDVIRSLASLSFSGSAAGGVPWGEPAISLHSHHVSLVQWTTCLLPVMRDPGETGILLLALSRYIGDHDEIRSLASLSFIGSAAGGSPVESLQSHFIHTMSHCPVDYPFASRHERPRFNPQGVTYVEPGFSC
jgi:hypothetical protein